MTVRAPLALASERKVQTAADHPEVVVRAFDDIPAEVIDPAKMAGETEFESATELADSFGL